MQLIPLFLSSHHVVLHMYTIMHMYICDGVYLYSESIVCTCLCVGCTFKYVHLARLNACEHTYMYSVVELHVHV